MSHTQHIHVCYACSNKTPCAVDWVRFCTAGPGCHTLTPHVLAVLCLQLGRKLASAAQECGTCGACKDCANCATGEALALMPCPCSYLLGQVYACHCCYALTCSRWRGVCPGMLAVCLCSGNNGAPPQPRVTLERQLLPQPLPAFLPFHPLLFCINFRSTRHCCSVWRFLRWFRP